MKLMISLTLLAVVISIPSHAGPTITYTYDARDRLVEADYSAVQSPAVVNYQYDAAGNIDLVLTITENQYLKSFIIWLSSRVPDCLEPAWLVTLKT